MGNAQNTNGKSWGGSRAGAGRRRKATCARNGRVYVALDMVGSLSINGHKFQHSCLVLANRHTWYVDGDIYLNFPNAAAEFVRRVNGA